MKISVWSHRSNIQQSCDLDKLDLSNSKDHGPFQTPGCLPGVLCLYGVGGTLGGSLHFQDSGLSASWIIGCWMQCHGQEGASQWLRVCHFRNENASPTPLLVRIFSIPFLLSINFRMYVCMYTCHGQRSESGCTLGPEGTSAHPCMCTCAVLVALGL